MTQPADTTAVRQELERAAGTKSETVLALIQRSKPEIAKLLPPGVTIERFERTVRTEVRRTPQLLECEPGSLLAAVMWAAQLGLEPGPLGHVYLVPRKLKGQRQVVFIVGYKGMVHLAYGSGVRSLRAATVYEGDTFTYEERERGPYLRHSEAPPAERGEPVCYYARAILASGAPLVRRIWPEDVEKARSHSSAPDSFAWVDHYDAMARKTAIRRLASTLPQLPGFQGALARDERAVPSIEDPEALVDTLSPTELDADV